MNLKIWETIIQQIVDESNQQPKETRNGKILFSWRAKLEKEPPHLACYQIDEIVREVRRRLESAGQ